MLSPIAYLAVFGLNAVLAAPIELRDDVGRELVLARHPSRIVSTAPANTELLFALGAGPLVVGTTSYCDYPPEARTRTRIGDFVSIDVEKVLELQPDLVVASWLAQKRWVEILEQRGLQVLVMFPSDLDGIMRSIKLLGRATDRESGAAKLVAGMRERLARVDERLAEQDDARPTVFVMLTTSPLFTVGPGSSLDEVVRRAGGRNLFGDISSAYAPISAEAVLARNPDVILMAHEVVPGEGLNIVRAMPGLAATRAAREARVIDDIDPALLVHPNHRLVEGIERLHDALAAAMRR